MEHLDPAKSIVGRIGAKHAADAADLHISRVYSWMYPKERGGTGGIIPQRHWPKLLAFAQANGIDLSPSDFINIGQGEGA